MSRRWPTSPSGTPGSTWSPTGSSAPERSPREALRPPPGSSVSPAPEVHRPVLDHLVVLDQVEEPVVGDRRVDVGGHDLDPVPDPDGALGHEGHVLVGA